MVEHQDANSPEQFECILVEEDEHGQVSHRITTRQIEQLPEGDVLIRVCYTSLNYKDALAVTGHRGVNKLFPLIPGVDAAGVVVESGVYEFVPGDYVLVTGYEMGAGRWGGWGQYVRVPYEWVIPLPDGLTLYESMIYGTAGLTAALCIDAIQHHGIAPEHGKLVVTGASGGVGSMAVAILAKLGYQVMAVTGKPTAHEFLKSLGAAEIVSREQFLNVPDRPLLSRKWAGGVDTVGGQMLSILLRTAGNGGCVACCGMAGGADLPITVYPFILRGITLAGVDAAWCPLEKRRAMWEKLAGPWKPDQLYQMAEPVHWHRLLEYIQPILSGRITGRITAEVTSEEELAALMP